MKYPSFESRIPREQATKTLERICERLDACASAQMDKPARFSESVPGPATAKRLWVVGSYARGAMTCGDIDLVMEVDNPSYSAGFLKRELFRNPQRVSLYTGTPEKNSSHAQFEGAVLVWEAGKDWRAALAGIELDESAGRHDRPTDSIPLRLEQAGGLAFAEAMLDSLARDELKWHFVPLEVVSPVTEPEAQAEDEIALYQRCRESGAGVRKLLPYVLGYVRRFGQVDLWWSLDSTTRLIQGSQLFVLGSTPALDELADLGLSRVVVMPHLSTRGPNGFWVIERGPRHPLATVFEGCEAWIITDGQGTPSTILAFASSSSYVRPVMAVDIFQSQIEAVKYAKTLDEDDPLDPGEVRDVRQIQGAALLDVLARCDLLIGGVSDTVFSNTGWSRALNAGYETDELTYCTAEKLAVLFRRTAERVQRAP